MGLVALLATLAYYPGALSSGISPKWWVMAVGSVLALAIVRLRPKIEWAFGAMFLGYGALSLTWTPDAATGANELVHLCVLALVFLVGTALYDLRGMFRGLAVGIGVNGVLCYAQWLWATLQPGVPLVPWFDQVSPDARYPAGLFFNHNFLAEAAVLALVGALVYRDWYFALPSALTLALVHSRASIVALATYGLFRMMRSGTFWLGYLVATCAVIAMYCTGVDNVSALERLANWHELANGISLLGSGLGAYQVYFSHAEHAHNDILQVVFEVGMGAAPMALLVLCALRRGGELCAVVGVVGVLALFGFPLELPISGFVGALALGCLCTRSSELRLAGRSGGTLDGPRPRAVVPGSGAYDW